MNAFVGYILLGISLAAPIGPINAAQLDKGIRFGFLHAWVIGLGAMLADAVFMLLIYFGSAHFLNIPFLKTFLWSFGCFVLLYTGIESVRLAGFPSNESRGEESLLKSFSSGFFMTFSNPLSILFWLGIYGSILAKAAESFGTHGLLLHSSGIFIGLLLWDLAMATTASVFKTVMSPDLLVWISRIASLSLIGFGLYFGFQAIKMILI